MPQSAPAHEPAPNILIVDDTPANLELLSDILREAGFVPRPVPSGKLTLAAARAAPPPDLFLLDVRMPEMDGFDLCGLLKADGKLKDIPVIFITARADTEDKLRAFSLGAVDYVTKPFQADEVNARVRTHLGLRRLQTEKEERHQTLLQTALDGFWMDSGLRTCRGTCWKSTEPTAA
jgi:putative two-component system response regulator